MHRQSVGKLTTVPRLSPCVRCNCTVRLFHTRYSLHKQVYGHRVSKAVEYMLCDVLLLADPVLHLSEAVLSASAYCRLTGLCTEAE